MNVDAARCFIRFANVYSSPSGESLDEFHRNILQWGEVLGYQFEPRQDSNNDIEDDQNILLTRTNLSFVWASLTGKTSYFIVYIDKLYFRVRQLCHSQ